MKTYVINGYPGAGKDTFVEMIQNLVPSVQIHSSDPAKRALTLLGWDGEKTEEDRAELAHLVKLSNERYDGVYKYIKNVHDCAKAMGEEKAFFIHEREPKNIERWKREFGAQAILIKRDSAKSINNVADSVVMDYTGYDILIMNNGDLKALEDKAKTFVQLELRGRVV